MTDTDPRPAAGEATPVAPPPPPADAPPPRTASPRTSTVAWIISLALAAVVGALLFASGYLVGGAGSGSCTVPNSAFAPFCEAYQKLKSEYVDKLDDKALAEGAILVFFL
jgi:hypothetical protein